MTVTAGAATAASRPGIVIIKPAVPSEIWYVDPIEVRTPIGNISVVTMEKMPIITEVTASQLTSGERDGATVVGAVMAPSPAA
jgi:hypothetical protein